MDSIERLIAEHNLIERALALLDAAVARIEGGQPIPADFPRWAVHFFQDFADQGHHAKEEDVFFPLLKERGIPEEGGPIGVMLHEHVLGRDCVRRMRESSHAQPFDAVQFAGAAKQYIPLLRQNIFKENNVLFRMAERVMSLDDDAHVTGRFTQVDEERGLVGGYESYADEISRWEDSLK
jgi:hemerythrin-like domain-containing protein